MEDLNPDSRQSIYFSVSYAVVTEWLSDKKKQLNFLKALLESQLDFSDIKSEAHSFTLLRKEQSSLQVRVASLGPQVSNILVKSDGPAYNLDLFAKEADAVYGAYRETYLKGECQVLQCDAIIRHLYSCSNHAFKYLWETRLGQKP
jgi:hypothetical protein